MKESIMKSLLLKNYIQAYLPSWLVGKVLGNNQKFNKLITKEVEDGITITMDESTVNRLKEVGESLRNPESEKETLVIQSPWGDISTYHFKKGKCILITENKAN